MSVNGMELCAGIGALGLGVARAIPGYRTVVASEIEAFAVAVLAARQQGGSLPPFPVWDDLTTFDGRAWRGVVDIVVAGFPCTDISLAGKGAGIYGERSGLWFDVLRVIRDVGPRFVFLENVAALTFRGLDTVLGGLAESGMSAEWGCLRASAVGAPHQRNRWWCLAWDREQLADAGRGQLRQPAECEHETVGRLQHAGLIQRALADRDGAGLNVNGQPNGRAVGPVLESPRRGDADGCDQDVGDAGQRDLARGASEQGRESVGRTLTARTGEPMGAGAWPGFPPGPGDRDGWRAFLERHSDLAPATQSTLRGRADGPSTRVDQLRALGNAAVPQQAEAALRALWWRAFGEVL